MRIRAAAELFFEELRVRRASLSLHRQTSQALQRLAAHLSENRVRDLRAVDEAHLASFARVLRQSMTPRGTPLSSASQNLYLQRVKSCFAFLVRRGLLLRDPAAELRLKVASPLPRLVLGLRQAARLMNAPSPETPIGKRDRAILETLYGTGIRRAECASLDVQDIDLRCGTLLVRDGKGHKDRLVPLPERAALALDSYLRGVRPELLKSPGEQALFLTVQSWRGRRLGVSAIVHLLRGHARAAGIAHVHPHALRHTCATHLLRGGADIRHVQAILGHRWIKTTALYTRVSTSDLAAVLRRCHPREGKRPRRR